MQTWLQGIIKIELGVGMPAVVVCLGNCLFIEGGSGVGDNGCLLGGRNRRERK